MSRRVFSLYVLAVALLLPLSPVSFMAARADFAEATEGLQKQTGLIDTYIDGTKSKILLALDAADNDGILGRYIYAGYLTGGLGSNPLGLDRSLPTGSQILAFKQVGDTVYAIIENTRFRASADNPREKRAVETSFAQSIIWSTSVVGTEAASGKILIDISGFLKRDAVGVAARLADRGQGSFRLVSDRSYVDTSAAFVFPENLEFDAYLTFSGTKPGAEIRTTTPDPSAVTLIAHTTLLKLPDDGYQIRANDPRAGVISTSFIDMSAPLDGDTVVSLARRFRLEKDETGKVIKPIIFYIDNGAPEPIRSALVEGGNWWADAFEKAGFPGGYRVEVLPEGVHPLDARYNVVNWVHRATRGWSYGAAVWDPRTGETLRGVVLLGSLRVRQDIKIFEALAGAQKTGTGAADDPVEMALARIRQLSAHEIGHALGFSHNMAASSYGNRASVMDYPAPDVRVSGETLDFSEVYGVGVGAWDVWVTNFLYGDYEGAERAYQAKLIREADAAGLVFVSDPDSRSTASGHPKGSVWDTGEDAVESLKKTLEVRALALGNFGAANLRPGEGFQALQTKFVPLYLYHRYQLAAAAKYIGGIDFSYRHQGDGRAASTYVPVAKQIEALDTVLASASPSSLAIRDETLLALSPLGLAGGDPQFSREIFRGQARPQFDPVNAARVASDMTMDAVLTASRAARLYEQGLRQPGHPGLKGVIDRVQSTILSWRKDRDQKARLLQSIVFERFVEKLINLVEDQAATLPVRDTALRALNAIQGDLVFKRFTHGDAVKTRIENALKRAGTPAIQPPSPPSIPPGSPIGESCWHCDTWELLEGEPAS